MSCPTVTSFTYADGVEFPEDIMVVRLLPDGYLLAVGDGVDGFHCPKLPRKLVGGESRAQIQGRTIQKYLLDPHFGEPLEQVLRGVVEELARNAKIWGILLSRPDELPAVDLAVARITGDSIFLHQMGGDALAFWLYRDGKVGATSIQSGEFRKRVIPEFRMHQEEVGVGEAWNRIEPTFRQARIDLTNTDAEGAYGTMNGQKGVTHRWASHVLATSELSLLLLCTDGLYEEILEKDYTRQVARKVIDLYQHGGWKAVFEARGDVSRKEGTGIAVEF